ncbi:hypothetical protein MKZ38_004581 [Zalerion maritima]|uniref:AA1-like domain-containing protein n=1 Tax=Zalerion maritima TaxID=339359 RepID=A0AAD5WXD2_9PEZI|nr:hypothetical protein MKZ38_004581 [Zalerion maritima]
MQLLTLLLFPFTILATPRGRPGGHHGGGKDPCTSVSLHHPTLQIEDFKYRASYLFTNPAHQNSHGYVTFNLLNDMVDTNVSCSASSSWLQNFFYGQIWYTCDDDASAFRYNYPTGELELNTTWTCDGGRSDATFNGTFLHDMAPTCTEENWQNPNWASGEFYSDDEIVCLTPLTIIIPNVVSDY